MDFMYLWGPFVFFFIIIGLMVWSEVSAAKGYDDIQREKRMDSALSKLFNYKEMS